ncbi:hypothetical protein HWV62_28489 [Athelia sp. TMB]|nr:hypothetical protein HWV62_28489 [Athelia sp. TMB]
MSDSGSEVKSRAEALLEARKEAQRDGLFAGVTSGLTSAIIGQRLMGFGKKTTLFCGAGEWQVTLANRRLRHGETVTSLTSHLLSATGVLSGYYFTQAFVDANLARLTIQEEAIYAAERVRKREEHHI